MAIDAQLYAEEKNIEGNLPGTLIFGVQGPQGEQGMPGKDGAPGKDGKDGNDGADGVTPHVGSNGNWFIGEKDTGTPATGPAGGTGLPGAPGEDGVDGKDGADGVSPTVEIGRNGKMVTVCITDKYSGKTFTINDGADGVPGVDGKDGKDGTDGVGIDQVMNIDNLAEHTVEMTLTDGRKVSITTKDGADGASMYLWDMSGKYDATHYTTSGVTLPEGKYIAVGDLLLTPNGDIYLVTESSRKYFVPVFKYSIKGADDSGGGAQSDWDAAEGEDGHVLNRPFYSEYEITSVIIEEIIPTEETTRITLDGSIDLYEGQLYLVEYNGKKYKCTAKPDGEYRVYIGNGVRFGKENTSEPFCIDTCRGTAMDNTVIASRSSESYIKSVVVYGIEETAVHKIPAKYLPDSKLPNPTPEAAGKAVVVNESGDGFDLGDVPSSGGGKQSDFNQNNPNALDYIKNRPVLVTEVDVVQETEGTFAYGTIPLLGYNYTNGSGYSDSYGSQLIEGKQYAVTWNGTVYYCTAEPVKNNYGYLSMGNIGAFLGGDDTGEPFAVLSDSNGFYVMPVPNVYNAEATYRIHSFEQAIEPQFIKDMYYVISEAQTIVPKTTITEWEEGMGFIPSSTGTITDGAPCEVSWNGSKYVCTCTYIEGSFFLGNIGALGVGEITTEPFAILLFPPEEQENYGVAGYVIPFDGSESVVLKINTQTNVQKIDNKYIGLDWFPIRKAKYYDSEKMGNDAYKNGTDINTYLGIPAESVVPGITYIVYYNDERFEREAKMIIISGNTFPYIGNYSLLDLSRENTGEPFCIFSNGIAMQVISEDDTYALSLYSATKSIEPDKMPEEYMPESVDSIIVRSSTEGSTKKFKVTVDDSGTLTATEV